jgi:hypothetical protein
VPHTRDGAPPRNRLFSARFFLAPPLVAHVPPPGGVTGWGVAVDAGGELEAQRGRLFGLAYRLLGSAAEAEDVV